MTLNKLASLIAKREGKKHQASIGDVREILAILDQLIAEEKFQKGQCGSSILKKIDERSTKLGVKLVLKSAKRRKAGK